MRGQLRRTEGALAAKPLVPHVEVEDLAARGGPFNRISVRALAETGVGFVRSSEGPPNLAVNAQGNLALITRRAAVRLAAPPTPAQRTALRTMSIELGDGRFGSDDVFIVTTPRPVQLAEDLRSAGLSFVAIEIEILTPLITPAIAAPTIFATGEYQPEISRPPDLSGEGAALGVIDSGFDEDHPALMAAWDKHRALSIAVDEHGNLSVGATILEIGDHGTSVAFVAGGVAANGESPGLAPGMTIVPVSIPSAASPLLFAEGLEHLVKHHVRSISGSVHLDAGVESSSVAIPAALRFAEVKDSVVVWAALNAETPRDSHWIGRHDSVVLVAGVDGNGKRLKGTEDVTLVAPGSQLTAAINEGKYDVVTGHSFAAPIVCAVTALVHCREPNLTAAQMRDRLSRTSCMPATRAGTLGYGAGVINVARCLERPLPSTPCPF